MGSKNFYYYKVFYDINSIRNFRTRTEAQNFIAIREKFGENCVLFRCVRGFNGKFQWTCIYDTLKERVNNE